MRNLLALAFTALATALSCHAIYLDPPGSETELVSAARGIDPNAAHPYDEHTLSARGRLFEAWSEQPPTSTGKHDPWEQAAARVLEGFGTEAPFLSPAAAAAVGLIGLLLALFLPRTRLRSMALLGLIFGAVAVAPLGMTDPLLADTLDAAGFLSPVAQYAPWSAIGLLVLAAFCLGFPVPERVRERVEIHRS